MDQGVPGSRPGRVAVHFGLELVTFTSCLALVKPRRREHTTELDEAGDYVVPYVLHRVGTRQGKVREIEIFSGSGNCQGILLTVREIWKYSQMSGNYQGILNL